MQFSSDTPGETIGSVMVLQAIVARLIASHPDREDIMGSLTTFSQGIHDGAREQSEERNYDAANFMKDIAGGVDGTIEQIGQYLALFDNGGGHLNTSATAD